MPGNLNCFGLLAARIEIARQGQRCCPLCIGGLLNNRVSGCRTVCGTFPARINIIASMFLRFPSVSRIILDGDTFMPTSWIRRHHRTYQSVYYPSCLLVDLLQLCRSLTSAPITDDGNAYVPSKDPGRSPSAVYLSVHTHRHSTRLQFPPSVDVSTVDPSKVA